MNSVFVFGVGEATNVTLTTPPPLRCVRKLEVDSYGRGVAMVVCVCAGKHKSNTSEWKNACAVMSMQHEQHTSASASVSNIESPPKGICVGSDMSLDVSIWDLILSTQIMANIVITPGQCRISVESRS